MNAGLIELIKAIRNRCDAVLAMQKLPDTEHLMATILEDLHEDSQAIIDDYCIKGEECPE